MAWLYRYETKGLQQWLLASNELLEIKGGSQLVVDLDTLFKNSCSSCCAKVPESVTAGSATVVFDTQAEALEFAAAWPMIVDRWAPGLRIAQAIVREDAGFAALIAALHADAQRASPHLPEVGSATFRSPSSDRPALPRHAWQSNSKIGPTLSDADSARRITRAQGAQDHAEDEPWVRLVGDFASVKAKTAQRRPITKLDEMGSSYIAIVHIDINDLGRRLAKLASNERGAFSAELAELTLGVARRAAGSLFAWTDKNGRVPRPHEYPLRPVVHGGDDLTLLTRGDLGIRYALEYLYGLHEASRRPDSLKILKAPVEACAGVAIVHTGFPFHRAHELAESLCKFSKSQLRGKGQENATPSGIAFYRSADSIVGDYHRVRRDELSVQYGGDARGEHLVLSACPYTLDDDVPGFRCVNVLEQLKDVLELPDMPAGPIRRALGEISSDRCTAVLKRLREVMVSGSPQAREAWFAFQSAAAPGAANDQGQETDWSTLFEIDPTSTGGSRRTMLLDALQWQRAETEGLRE